jgi:trans-aconitate methyltransferase
MSAYDPIDLLFGGMEKLGPGSNADSLHVLRLLPERPWRSVVDAGCGTGRQTLLLAKELGVIVHAIDSHQPFLDSLVSRAQEEQLGHLVEVHCMDMKAIPQVFQGVDLLWSEGAAYNIGFPHALAVWGSSVAAHGLAVVSELSWLKQQVPAEVTDFFRSGYPDMQSVPDNPRDRAERGLQRPHDPYPSAASLGGWLLRRPCPSCQDTSESSRRRGARFRR